MYYMSHCEICNANNRGDKSTCKDLKSSSQKSILGNNYLKTGR
jgi:hypothetical protein